MSRIARALERAHAGALELPEPSRRAARTRARRVAIGDPQAPLETFFAVLEHHGLLGEDGWLRPDTLLVTMGDHFDWGSLADVPQATADGLALLAWLARHDDDQVVLLAGNHDLGRVGELAGFDDESFARMRADAAAVYAGDRTDAEAQRSFLGRWPSLPSAEVGARDLAAFSVPQRRLVTHLLRMGRLRLAHAPHDHLLLVHAGLTAPQLRAAGIDPTAGARAIARELDARLAESVRGWAGPPEPLVIPGLHRPGDAEHGEGGGVLFHRGASVLEARVADRRFDPRELPRGLAQGIGHVRDRKQRDLLGPAWHDGQEAEDGPLRHLITDGHDVRYARGLPEGVDLSRATMLYLDGGMRHAPPERYELLELDDPRLRALPRAPS